MHCFHCWNPEWSRDLKKPSCVRFFFCFSRGDSGQPLSRSTTVGLAATHHHHPHKKKKKKKPLFVYEVFSPTFWSILRYLLSDFLTSSGNASQHFLHKGLLSHSANFVLDSIRSTWHPTQIRWNWHHLLPTASTTPATDLKWVRDGTDCSRFSPLSVYLSLTFSSCCWLIAKRAQGPSDLIVVVFAIWFLIMLPKRFTL